MAQELRDELKQLREQVEAIAPAELEELRERVTAIEVGIDRECYGSPAEEVEALQARLQAIEERLTAIEKKEYVSYKLFDESGLATVRTLEYIRDDIRKLKAEREASPAPPAKTDNVQNRSPLSPVDRDEPPETDRPAEASPPPAIGPGDRDKWVICEILDGRPVRYWNGDYWTDILDEATRYQSEKTLKPTLKKLEGRKRDNPETQLRYNTIGAIERLLEKLDS